MDSLINKYILNNFHKISLSAKEKEIAQEAIKDKYVPSILKAIFLSFLLVPATLFLDTAIIISILIPITMVAGTAWFSVSLASMKEKFERFGLELTLDLFTAFTLSLIMLMVLTIASMTQFMWEEHVSELKKNYYILVMSASLGVVVVWNLIWSVFKGSLKYDINDSMLAGQNELAELFFKRSISILYKTSDLLRSNPDSTQVANYSLGVAFFEVYNYMKEIGLNEKINTKIESSIELANKLIKNPSMPEEEADKLAIKLLDELIFTYIEPSDSINLNDNKSYLAIKDELECLKVNQTKKKEERPMVDLRLSVALLEIAILLDSHGQLLFRSDTN